MFNMFKHPSGNIAIALLLSVIAVMSGFTLSSMAMNDVVAFQYDFENFQSTLFLRSEAYRGQKIAQKLGTILIPVRTSERSIELTNSALKKTFKIQSLLSKGHVLTSEEVVMGDQRQQTIVESLVKSKTGIGQVAAMNSKFSMIRKYGIYTLETETFAKYMYFTDTDESPNGTNVYFHGPDMLYGRVHSNTDIWIKQTYGGVNGGWPIFYGWVSTAGEIQSHSGSYSESQVFPGGLSEGYDYVVFPESAALIRRNGQKVGPYNYSPDVIVYVEVDGASFTYYRGDIQSPHIENADVYNPYPPPTATEPLFTNTYQVRDTVWTFGAPGTANNRSNWVNNRLWIRGTFATYQTWGCADTMFLLDDILLENTPVGSDPTNNNTDVVGLVSEKSIVIKYGYRGPVDTLRHQDTCGSDTGYGGIWIYAAMAALGNGHGNTHKDGVFTFEYQHPHPSVPDYRYNNILYTKIDLHRYHFPQSNRYKWATCNGPRNLKIDYPWYNPLWPERTPYLERGYINIYGSVSQRRRGFVHRSYYDEEWPSNNEWNQPIDFCGPTSAPTAAGVQHNDPVFGFLLNNVNYPGTSGTGTGYEKNYHYDNRFYHTSPIDFPQVNRKDETPFAAVNWVIKRPPEYL